MKKLIVASALLLLLSAPSPSAAGADPKLRLALTPMLGITGRLGVGADVGMVHGRAAWGLHSAYVSEVCVMCDRDPETEGQVGLMAGVREEFGYGSVSFRSGIAMIARDTKDYDFTHGVRTYKGLGVPIQLDMMVGGRFIGLSISVMVLVDGDGGSSGLMAGIPFGLLRW